MSALHTRVSPELEQGREVLRTVRDLVRYAASRFGAAQLSFGHGCANAHDEAVYLTLWSLHLDPERLEPYLDARLTADEIDAALALVERRCTERVPASYLSGEAWLRGLRFLCDERALVPRSLIAEALDDALAAALPVCLPQLESATRAWPEHVLDLCTGGGSLAIFAADQFESASILAADLSADALALASENLALHGLTERVQLAQGDLYAPLAGRRFDLILCNPPYVNAVAMAALPPEYQAEPRAALDGGADGMDLVRRILAGALHHLSDDGVLLLEIGHEADHFEAAFPALEFIYLEVSAGARMLVLVTRTQIEALAHRTPGALQ